MKHLVFVWRRAEGTSAKNKDEDLFVFSALKQQNKVKMFWNCFFESKYFANFLKISEEASNISGGIKPLSFYATRTTVLDLQTVQS